MVIQGISYPSDFEAKKAMIAAAARLESKGAMVAGDGSLSVRVGPNAIWITVDGADKAALTQDQMVRIDLNGKQMATNRPRPLGPDLDAHLKIYKENEAVQAVIHAYPVCSVILGAKGIGVEAAGFAPSVRKLGRIQLTRSADPKAAADEIALLCKTDKGAVIPNDGCMMWGRSIGEAAGLIDALEYYCKAARCLGHNCGGAGCGSGSCDGNCEGCIHAAACPDRRMAAGSAAGSLAGAAWTAAPAAPYRTEPAAPDHESLPSGMTGLIRGGKLPPLPEAPKPEAPKPAAVAPAAAAPVPRAPRVPAAVVAPAAAAPLAAPAARSQQDTSKQLVINTPKADVIAEVVRRSFGG